MLMFLSEYMKQGNDGFGEERLWSLGCVVLVIYPTRRVDVERHGATDASRYTEGPGGGLRMAAVVQADVAM